MRYIFYILLIINFLFGNEELDNYLNNKDLQYQVIKDEKNQRIIIDLLYEENRMIVFTKNENGNYQKTFDNKVYICNKGVMSNPLIDLKDKKVAIICALPNVENGVSYEELYIFEDFLNLDSKLLSIEKKYINIDDDSIKAKYIFKPQKNIPTLKDYTNENFSEKYLDENHKNFIKVNNPKPQSKNTLIEKEKSFFSKLLEWFGFSKLNKNMSFMYS